jgi:hypothetical protein
MDTERTMVHTGEPGLVPHGGTMDTERTMVHTGEPGLVPHGGTMDTSVPRGGTMDTVYFHCHSHFLCAFLGALLVWRHISSTG